MLDFIKDLLNIAQYLIKPINNIINFLGFKFMFGILVGIIIGLFLSRFNTVYNKIKPPPPFFSEIVLSNNDNVKSIHDGYFTIRLNELGTGSLDRAAITICEENSKTSYTFKETGENKLFNIKGQNYKIVFLRKVSEDATFEIRQIKD